MTGRLLTMSDPPPPTNPPPGWYPDPDGESGHRWWNGVAWTESVDTGEVRTAVEAASESPSPIGVFGPWFSESFRLTVSRAGHFLPMVLLFVLSVGLPASFALWFALRDTVLTFDQASAAPEIDYGGSSRWLIVVLATIPISAIGSFICKASAARQAWAAQADEPEPWSRSVAEVLRRWQKVVGYSLLRACSYWALTAVFVVAASLSPGFILMFPFLAAVLLFLWVRWTFVGTVAALAEPSAKPLAVSWDLSGRQFGALMGRLLVLAFVAFNMVLVFGILGAPFTAIAGGGSSTVATTAETLRTNDLLGDSATVFAIGALFNTIGLGAHYVLSAVGTTLLYRNLGGSVAAATASAATASSDLDAGQAIEAGPAGDPSGPSDPVG